MYHYTMKDEDGNELNDGQHLLILNADYERDWRLKDHMNDIKAFDPETVKYEVQKDKTIMRTLNVSEETIKKSKRQCNEN